LFQNHNYTSAEEYLWKALEVTKGLGNRHQLRALAFENLAYLEMKMGNYQPAEMHLIKAMQIRKRAPSYVESVVQNQIRLSQIYLMTNRHAKAKSLLAEVKIAFDNQERLGSNTLMSYRTTMALMLQTEGNFSQALSVLRNCLRYENRRSDPESIGSVEIRRAIGLVYLDQGKNQEALRIFSHCNRDMNEIPGKEILLKAQIYADLGATYSSLKDYGKAQYCFETSLSLLDAEYGKLFSRSAWVLTSYVDVLRLLHRDKEADILEHRLQEIKQSNGLPNDLYM